MTTRFFAEYRAGTSFNPSIAIADFPYTKIDGTKGRLQDHAGKPVVLHFWATWCPPCIEELPELLDKAAITPDVSFLIISVDKDQAALRRFLLPYEKQTQGKNVYMLHDPAMKIAVDHMKVSAFPESFFLNSALYKKRHIKGPVRWVSFDDF